MLAIWMKEILSPLRHIKLLHACYMNERLSLLRHIKLLHVCYVNETKVVSTETYQIATCLLYDWKKDCLCRDISNCSMLAIWMKEILSPLRHIKLLHACYMNERLSPLRHINLLHACYVNETKVVSTETYQIATCLLYEWKKGCLCWDIWNCYMLAIWKKERWSPLWHIKLLHACYMNERKVVSTETYQTATCLLYEWKKGCLCWDISNYYMLAIWMKERLSLLRHIKLLHDYMNERKMVSAETYQIATFLLYEWNKGCLCWDVSNCYMLAIWIKVRLSLLRHIKLLHACYMNERKIVSTETYLIAIICFLYGSVQNFSLSCGPRQANICQDNFLAILHYFTLHNLSRHHYGKEVFQAYFKHCYMDVWLGGERSRQP